MRTSCLAILLIASLAPAADPPARPVKPTSELGSLLAKEGYTAVPLIRAEDNTFLVRVKVDGHAFTLVLDTGAAMGITLTKAAGKTLSISSDTHTFEGEPGSPAISGKKYGLGDVQEVSFDGTDYRAQDGYVAQVIDGLVCKHAVFDPKKGKDEQMQTDGLLGQRFLTEHSAVIDHDTDTLYLIPLAKKDGPKLLGRWECTGGERDGNPLDKLGERWVEFRKDDEAVLHLSGDTVSGRTVIRPLGGRRQIAIEVKGKDDAPLTVARGVYRVEGDRLKFCLKDEPVEPKVVKWEGVYPPARFEGRKGDGHVLYEFKRLKVEKK